MRPARRLGAAEAFRWAFRVAPEVAREVCGDGRVGIYGWRTPEFEGFELPETDDLVLALHLGGSRRVRVVTAQGLSPEQSVPGLITLLPPGTPAAFRTEGSVRVLTLHLPRPQAPSAPLARLYSRETPRFAFRDPYVGASMEALLRAAQSDRPLLPDYVGKVVDALLSHLAQWLGPDEAARADEGAALRELLVYVDDHLGAKLSLDDLASRVGMSRARFTRSFRHLTGLPAHQYLTQRRVEAAKRLLRQTDRDIAWIAQETGFSSQSHFTGQFRAVTGCTPARFRERRS